MDAKKDCFAYDGERNICTALRALRCKWEDCKFYKKEGELCKGCPNNKHRDATCARCIEARRG